MKPLPCPFCGATPHRGLSKVKHCQLHGDPYHDYLIWCPKGHAKVVGTTEYFALTEWNTRYRPEVQPFVDTPCPNCKAKKAVEIRPGSYECRNCQCVFAETVLSQKAASGEGDGLISRVEVWVPADAVEKVRKYAARLVPKSLTAQENDDGR